MIDISQELFDLLSNAPSQGIAERKLVYFTVRDRDTGENIGRGVWDGSEDLAITVRSGTTGVGEQRTYFAAALVSVGEISCTTDMTVQSVTIDLSQIADIAQALFRSYDARLARVEVHTLYLDPITGAPVGTLLDWVGEVDKAPLTTPTAGNEGKIELTTVSDIMSMLTRINGRKSSYEDQKKHAGGDEWSKYASTVGSWKIPWGQKST